jgi:hypothetical protein
MHMIFVLLFSAFLASGTPVPKPGIDPPNASSPARASVELEISGPRLIRAGQNLKFRVFLVNRSSQVIAVPSPTGGYRPSFNWTITDTTGRALPVPPLFICGTKSAPSVGDNDFIFLQPGERTQIMDVGDPSNYFLFPGKGSYRVSLALQFIPPRIWHSADGSLTHYSGISGSTMTPDKQDHLLNAPTIEAASNNWTVYLSD